MNLKKMKRNCQYFKARPLSHDDKRFRRRGPCLVPESRHIDRLYGERNSNFKGRTHLRLPADEGFNHGVAHGQWSKISKILYLNNISLYTSWQKAKSVNTHLHRIIHVLALTQETLKSDCHQYISSNKITRRFLHGLALHRDERRAA